jgi:hypothetical protein
LTTPSPLGLIAILVEAGLPVNKISRPHFNPGALTKTDQHN